MKKFYAILLSAVLVLGFAAVASAATLTATGTLEFTGAVTTADWGYDGMALSDLKLKFANAWGPASADVTAKFSLGPVDITDSNDDTASVNVLASKIDSANFNYKLSDSLTAGVLYKNGGYKLYSANIWGDWKVVPNLAKVAMTFDGGSLSVFSDLNPSPVYFYGAGAYTFDPVTVNGWFAYEGDVKFIAEAKYAVSDELSVTGGVLYDDGAIQVGGKGVFETDVIDLEGVVAYDIDTEAIDYNVYAEYNLTDNTSVYGEYDKADGLMFGAAYEFGTDTSLSGEYSLDDEAFTVTLSLAL